MEIKSFIIESITKFYSYMTISISIYTVTQLLKIYSILPCSVYIYIYDTIVYIVY